MGLMSLLRSKREAEQNERTDAAGELFLQYRQLLERADSPMESDEERVTELARLLGLSDQHIELHAVAIAELRRMEQQVAELPAAQSELDQLDEQEKSLVRQWEAIQSKLETLRAKRVDIRASHTHLEILDKQRQIIAWQFRELTGAPDDLPPALWSNRFDSTTPNVDKLRRRLFGNDKDAGLHGTDYVQKFEYPDPLEAEYIAGATIPAYSRVKPASRPDVGRIVVSGEGNGTLGFSTLKIGAGKEGRIVLCSVARNLKERVRIRVHKHAALQVGRNAYPGPDGTITDVHVRAENGEAVSDNNFVQKRTHELGPVIELHDDGTATVIMGG